MKRALVLSGGGARGAFQVGMLRELIVSQGLDFHVLRGVSVGALNAAFLAQAGAGAQSQRNLAAQVEKLERLWRDEIRGNRSVYATRAGFAGLLAGKDSLYSLKPLRRLIDQHISVADLRASQRDFAVGTVSLVTGEYEEHEPTAPDFIERFVASASIPVVFPFVDLPAARDVLVDGGVRNITPLSSAFRSQPDEIYVLLASRLERTAGDRLPTSGAERHTYDQWDDSFLGTRVGGLDVLKRTVDLLTDEVYLEDIRGALDWNAIAEATAELEHAVSAAGDLPERVAKACSRVRAAMGAVNKRAVKIHVLAPGRWFDPAAERGKRNSSTEFSPGLIAQAIEHGEEVAADPSRWVWPVVLPEI